MLDLSQTVVLLDAIILPMIGIAALLVSKVAQGDLARYWQKQFLLCLVVMTVVTLRTVIYSDETWLVRTMTLGGLIVGALMVPSHENSVAV